jgi:methyltransferase (TIGR00027 family)
MNFISFIVFIPLQIIFLPIGLLGILLVAYKQMVVSKRLGVSQTAIEVLNGRWTMHVFGVRQDKAAEILAKSMPNTSTIGLWLCLFPLWVKYKISNRLFGYPRVPNEGQEGIVDIVVARTLYFDRIIDQLADDIEQFVVLGAGYDTRAYGGLKNRGLTFFELDQPMTQKLKVTSLDVAGIHSSHVNFVSVDFSHESIFEKLRANGYDPNKKTIFLWEGVTLYLTEADVRKTLRDIKENAAPGSAVVADFYGERIIKAGTGSVGKKVLGYTNEEFGFGLPFATNFENILECFLNSENLKLAQTYFMGSSNTKGPFMVVAEVKV